MTIALAKVVGIVAFYLLRTKRRSRRMPELAEPISTPCKGDNRVKPPPDELMSREGAEEEIICHRWREFREGGRCDSRAGLSVERQQRLVCSDCGVSVS